MFYEGEVACHHFHLTEKEEIYHNPLNVLNVTLQNSPVPDDVQTGLLTTRQEILVGRKLRLCAERTAEERKEKGFSFSVSLLDFCRYRT